MILSVVETVIATLGSVVVAAIGFWVENMRMRLARVEDRLDELEDAGEPE